MAALKRRPAEPPGRQLKHANVRRYHERRDSDTVTPESLLRDANRLIEAVGIVRSQSWLVRTVREYFASRVEGIQFGAFLLARVELNAQQRRRVAERADLRYLLTYLDPTGELAAHNVDKEKSHGLS